jgi:hypothetical protein
MLSAPECFHHANRCEEQAEDTGDLALLEMAARWRKLGNKEQGRDQADMAFPQSMGAERAVSPSKAVRRA